jgi:hypothetical protein
MDVQHPGSNIPGITDPPLGGVLRLGGAPRVRSTWRGEGGRRRRAGGPIRRRLSLQMHWVRLDRHECLQHQSEFGCRSHRKLLLSKAMVGFENALVLGSGLAARPWRSGRP